MKKIVYLLSLTMIFSAASAQVNEEDTTLVSVAAQSRSLELVATSLPGGVQLQWSKGPDDYTGYFELYRSADGISYNIVKQFRPATFGANQNSYSYTDAAPLRGKNFYRLLGFNKYTHEKNVVEAVVDYDGRAQRLTPTILVSGDNLNISNYDGRELELVVYNSGATAIFKRVVSSSLIPLPANLSPGFYVYQLVDRKRSIVTSGKFVLQ